MKRMSLHKFGKIVARVVDTLPAEIKQHLDSVVVDVEDEPDDETLREMGFSEAEIAEGETLLGLFAPLRGVHSEALSPEDVPNRIIIYKRPHEDSFPDRRQMMIEIRKTIIHEIAHHFGWSDRDLEKWDNMPDPFGEEGIDN